MTQEQNKITDNLFWLGVNNPDSRDFHGIYTPRGGSYNSCLINDDKPTIIDTCNTPFLEQFLNNLKDIIEPEKIEYIVFNHIEPDHSGAIKKILEYCKNAKIVCTLKAKEMLIAAYNLDCEFIETNEETELKLGKTTLKFFMDPMVHWPETMITYNKELKALFSGDLFGTEISHEDLFADNMQEFKKLTRDYYAIVMRPFKGPVKKAIDKVKNLELNYLIPSHGPIYRKDFDKIISYYEKLSTNPQENKITIIYYSIWHSTQKIAEKIQNYAKQEGIEVNVFDISKSNLIELMAECMTSKVVLLGSLTIIGSYHPLFDALFPLLKLNGQKNKISASFGSYGWGEVAVKKISEKLKSIEYDVIDTIDFRFGAKNKSDNKKIEEFTKNIINKMNNQKD